MPSTLKEILLLLTLTALAAASTQRFHPYAPPLYLSQEPPSEGEITAAEARAAQSDPGVIFVDARVRRLYDAAHIPGAFSLCEHEADFPTQLVTVAEACQQAPDKWCVVYCDGKACQASRAIAEILHGLHPNPERVKVLHGGWPAWQTPTP